MNKFILYIEDDKFQRILAKRCIERGSYDFDIDFAETGQKGIDTFDHHKHSLVVIDYNLPDMNAPEVAVKLLSKCNSFPIVYLSTAYRDEYLIKAKLLGIKDCITKDNIKDNLDHIATFL